MDLPVVNKEKADHHIRRLVVFIILIYLAFYLLTHSLQLLFYFTLFNVLVSILLIRYYRRNNFTARFIDNHILVQHRGVTTEIPLTEIWDVKNEISNYLGKELQLAVVYTLYLRKVYPFGDEIHSSYTFSKDCLEKDPELIQQIKKMLEISKKIKL